MNFDKKLIEEKAKKLLEGLREQYPFVYTSLEVVEKYVRQSEKCKTTPTVDLLYDYVLSQDLCEVEE